MPQLLHGFSLFFVYCQVTFLMVGGSYTIMNAAKTWRVIVLLTRCLNWFTLTMLTVSTDDTGYAYFVVHATWYNGTYLESAQMIRDECYGNFQSKQPGLQRVSIDRILVSLITRNYINQTIVNLVQIKRKKDPAINIIVTRYHRCVLFRSLRANITYSGYFIVRRNILLCYKSFFPFIRKLFNCQYIRIF